MRTFTTSNVPRSDGFTFAEIMLVIIGLALLAGISGTYYGGSHKKSMLVSTTRQLLLTGKYARMFAVENQKTCRLCIDRIGNQFYLLAPPDNHANQADEVLINNPYCRKTALKKGIEIESMDIQPAMGENDVDVDTGGYIYFYPDGCCDSAVIQVGNGRYSYTVVFSPAYAKIKIYEGPATDLETNLLPIDLDAMERN